uniref:FP protein C-terminal domain-containing protein n=1 Tax=Cacopsylla melanoneura TaxID=428564 RepID=A0A8D8V008_9HEMI
MECPRCEEPINPLDELQCIVCNKVYHYSCCGHTERNFNKMSAADKQKQRCTSCKDQKKEVDSKGKDKSVPTKEKVAPPAKDLPSMERKLMEYFDSKFGLLEETIANQKNEVIQALSNQVSQLEQKLVERDHKILDLEEKVDMLENRSRISNLEIRNMPETKNEDVKFMVKKIGETIGVPNIQDCDIQVAHRVNNRNGSQGIRPVVVHLSSRYMRNIWIQKYKDFKKKEGGAFSAKKVNGSLPDAKVFLHEHITVSKKLLLNDVRAFARDKNIQFVWVKDAMILVKKSEADRQVTKISSKREFETFKTKIIANL